MRSIVATILLIHLFLTTAFNNSEHESFARKEKNYKEGFVESDKVKLQYLDWGGDGQVLSEGSCSIIGHLFETIFSSR